jgi:hypothetical protein
MILRATIRQKHGNDFVRMIDISNAADLSKVARAAGAAAMQTVRAMPLYGPAKSSYFELHLEWVADAAPVTNHQPPATARKHARPKRRK